MTLCAHAFEVPREPAEAARVFRRNARELLEAGETFKCRAETSAQMADRRIYVLQRNIIPRKGRDTNERGAKWVDGQSHKSEQIANFVTFKQAAEVEDRNAAFFQRGGDFVQTPVGSAE